LQRQTNRDILYSVAKAKALGAN